MEEMAGTQEEMKRKEVALEDRLEEIESERAKNLAILEACVDGVISFDADGTVEFCNRAAEDVFGYSVRELIGRSIFQILNIHISANGEEPILVSQAGNRITSRSEVNATHRNGDELSLLLTA